VIDNISDKIETVKILKNKVIFVPKSNISTFKLVNDLSEWLKSIQDLFTEDESDFLEVKYTDGQYIATLKESAYFKEGADFKKKMGPILRQRLKEEKIEVTNIDTDVSIKFSNDNQSAYCVAKKVPVIRLKELGLLPPKGVPSVVLYNSYAQVVNMEVSRVISCI